MRYFVGLFFAALLTAFPVAAQQTRIYLTSGTTWVVPLDFNSQANTIEIVGRGGSGGDCAGGPVNQGGGGGAYSSRTNVVLTPGSTASVNFSLASGGLTWFGSSTTIVAQNGFDATFGSCATAKGGQAAAGFGTIKFSGGDAGTGPGGGSGLGMGGGAAGSHGNGGNGGNGSGPGGTGDAGFGGAGGSSTVAPGTGGTGTEWDASHGSGGGGGSESSGAFFGAGGYYGGGGGYNAAGAPAIIVITYLARQRVSSGVF